MSRELLIVRHGKSDWSQDTSDFDRPLKKRGIRGANNIGSWIRHHHLLPEKIYSSPAVRARDTANISCKSMALSPKLVKFKKVLYLADREDLLALLQSIDHDLNRVMIVGHNPGLEDLVEYLLGNNTPQPDDGKLLPTATLAHVVLPDSWKNISLGEGRLIHLVRAGDL